MIYGVIIGKNSKTSKLVLHENGSSWYFQDDNLNYSEFYNEY